MLTQIVNGIRIYVSRENPYSSEWSAVDENYDAETDEYGTWRSLEPIGYGDTPEEAIKDLLEQQAER